MSTLRRTPAVLVLLALPLTACGAGATVASDPPAASTPAAPAASTPAAPTTPAWPPGCDQRATSISDYVAGATGEATREEAAGVDASAGETLVRASDTQAQEQPQWWVVDRDGTIRAEVGFVAGADRTYLVSTRATCVGGPAR